MAFGAALREAVNIDPKRFDRVAILNRGRLVACDTLARTVMAPAELPVGVITAIIGIYLTRPRAGESGLVTINRAFYISAVISAEASAGNSSWIEPLLWRWRVAAAAPPASPTGCCAGCAISPR